MWSPLLGAAMADAERALGWREVALAAAATVLVVGGALAADPQVRASVASHPAVRDVLCEDGVVVDVVTNDGWLAVPEGGMGVRVREGETDLPSHLMLYRRDPGGEWYAAWPLDAPSGREVYYLAVVEPGTEAYVLAQPVDPSHCPARSETLRARS